MPEIQAISFDVGGTLIQPWPSVGDVYAAVAREMGIRELSAAQLNRRFLAAWKALGCRAESKGDWAAVVRETFAGLASATDLDLLFELLYTRFTERSVWHVYDDVVPTLDSLRARGMKLAIASNWDERLRPLLAQLDLLDYFDAIVVSCEIGFRKPQPEFFGKVAEGLELPAERVVHVGDSQDHDVCGARNAGFHSLGIQRKANKVNPPWVNTLSVLMNSNSLIETCMNKHA